ncbi:MAG: hypothetical protein AB7Q64_23855 [Verrucomicrobiales bacterium]
MKYDTVFANNSSSLLFIGNHDALFLDHIKNIRHAFAGPPEASGAAACGTFSHECGRILIGDSSGMISCYEFQTGKLLWHQSSGTYINSIGIHEPTKTVIAEGSVKSFIDLESGEIKSSPFADFHSFCFFDGGFLATKSRSASVFLFGNHSKDGRRLEIERASVNSKYRIAVQSPQILAIVFFDLDEKPFLFRRDSGEIIQTVSFPNCYSVSDAGYDSKCDCFRFLTYSSETGNREVRIVRNLEATEAKAVGPYRRAGWVFYESFTKIVHPSGMVVDVESKRETFLFD